MVRNITLMKNDNIGTWIFLERKTNKNTESSQREFVPWELCVFVGFLTFDFG